MNTTNTEQEMSPTDRTEMKPSAAQLQIRRLIEQLGNEVERDNAYMRAFIGELIDESKGADEELEKLRSQVAQITERLEVCQKALHGILDLCSKTPAWTVIEKQVLTIAENALHKIGDGPKIAPVNTVNPVCGDGAQAPKPPSAVDELFEEITVIKEKINVLKAVRDAINKI